MKTLIHVSFACLALCLFGCPEPSGGVSQAEVTQAIGDHAAQGSAHHTKTTDASELTTGTIDVARLPAPAAVTDADIVATGANGSIMPHECEWIAVNTNVNSTNRTATCPVGKHPFTGGCQGNGTGLLEINRTAGIPTSGDAPTTQDAWYCQWDVASTLYVATALCCHF